MVIMNENCQLNMLSIIKHSQHLNLGTLNMQHITNVFMLVYAVCKFIILASLLKCRWQEVKVFVRQPKEEKFI